MVRHWHRLSRETVAASSLKCTSPGWMGFEQPGVVEGTLPMAGVWKLDGCSGPVQPRHFYDLMINATSAHLPWLEVLFSASPLSLLQLKSLLSSCPIPHSCPFSLPNHSSFNHGPLTFSRKLFVPCKRNIDFYITWPMRHQKLHFSRKCGLSLAFRKKISFGPCEISCSGWMGSAFRPFHWKATRCSWTSKLKGEGN